MYRSVDEWFLLPLVSNSKLERTVRSYPEDEMCEENATQNKMAWVRGVVDHWTLALLSV
jgi:hypothetical protein